MTSRDAVTALVRGLSCTLANASPVREACAQALARIGPGARDVLFESLRDSELRLSALRTLAAVPKAAEDPRILKATLALLRDDSPEVRAAALGALAPSRVADVAKSIVVLLDPEKEPEAAVRVQAARALGGAARAKGKGVAKSTAPAVAALARALDTDPSVLVRREAASALGEALGRAEGA